MSDVYSKKDAVWGMLLQGIAILIPFATAFYQLATISAF
jgi:hypothetical protein